MTQDPIDELMIRLRREYLAEMPGRLEALSDAIAAWGRGEIPAASLLTLFHRLSGSAGTYGFAEVSRICRGTEQWLSEEPDPRPEAVARVEQAVRSIGVIFRRGPPDRGGSVE